VLIIDCRNRQNDDEPSQHLFFAEVPDRCQSDQERFGGAGNSLLRMPQTSPQTHRSGFQDRGQRAPDHQTSLDYDDAPEWAR
jgi:hypothetical protein